MGCDFLRILTNNNFQFWAQVVSMVLTWMLFSDVPINTFFFERSLDPIILVAIAFSLVIMQFLRHSVNKLQVILLDIIILTLGLKILITNQPIDSALLLFNLIMINILLLTKWVQESHCKWVIFGLSYGSGMAFLINISHFNYLSLIALMNIALLIFLSTFFSIHIFINRLNNLYLLAILLVCALLMLTFKITLIKVCLVILIMLFFMYYRFLKHSRNYFQRNNFAIFSQLLIAITLFI